MDLFGIFTVFFILCRYPFLRFFPAAKRQANGSDNFDWVLQSIGVLSAQGFSVQKAEDAVAQVACQLIAAILLGCEVMGIQAGLSFVNSEH